MPTAPTAEILAAIYATHKGQRLRVVYTKEGAPEPKPYVGTLIEIGESVIFECPKFVLMTDKGKRTFLCLDERLVSLGLAPVEVSEPRQVSGGRRAAGVGEVRA